MLKKKFPEEFREQRRLIYLENKSLQCIEKVNVILLAKYSTDRKREKEKWKICFTLDESSKHHEAYINKIIHNFTVYHEKR